MKLSLVFKLSVFVSLFAATATVSADDFVKLVQSCESCHGKDGISTTPDVPIIAGFSHEGFLNTMDVFRVGDRIALKFHKPGEPETVMNEIAKGLSDKEVLSLADYFSQREFKAPQQSVNTELARRGEVIHKRLCDKCHTDNGAHPVEDAAILAGQWTPYLRRQFDNFLSGKRMVPRTMLRRIKQLSKDDIEALLNFYASEGMQ
jgi:sulfide dehydrogenase cytochrome subunit